jgi:hypothetical protein
VQFLSFAINIINTYLNFWCKPSNYLYCIFIFLSKEQLIYWLRIQKNFQFEVYIFLCKFCIFLVDFFDFVNLSIFEWDFCELYNKGVVYYAIHFGILFYDILKEISNIRWLEWEFLKNLFFEKEFWFVIIFEQENLYMWREFYQLSFTSVPYTLRIREFFYLKIYHYVF